MLRAVSSIYVESQALELFATARRDVFKLFRTSTYSTAASQSQTVLTSSSGDGAPPPAGERAQPPPPPPRAPPPPPPRRAWTAGAAAIALTASLGGMYYYRKLSDEETKVIEVDKSPAERAEAESAAWREPRSGAALPRHVQFLLVGAGTASFAAMRAIRSLRPDSQVLMVGEEPALPYMRPPLSKELWREPALAAAELPALTFRQWNGKRRSVLYEPPAFYVPVERLAGAERGGAAVARGWRVTRLDVNKHEAELSAPGQPPVTLTYDKCLLATGVRARRVPALRAAAAAGRSLTLRGVRDAQRLAAALDDPDVKRVAIVGGGFLATELSAALADRLQGSGKTVTQLYREEAPLAGVLPRYLAAEAARRLARAGVALRGRADVLEGEVLARGVRLRLADGAALDADVVVECVGCEPDEALAARSGLEWHAALGGLLVNAELQARSDVYAAGDAACFYDVALGRRRVEHHDHAVVSGRLAGENMAAAGQPKHYTHQSMFWSDLGPHLGYEAIGIIDSQLPTVGVFSAEAVADAGAESEVARAGSELASVGSGAASAGSGVAKAGSGAASAGSGAASAGSGAASAASSAHADAASAGGEWGGDWGGDDAAAARRYARGVVFYVRERRVVGVLLWNLFNRMHVARQVLAHGEFDDLFEVAKLFDLHDDD